MEQLENEPEEAIFSYSLNDRARESFHRIPHANEHDVDRDKIDKSADRYENNVRIKATLDPSSRVSSAIKYGLLIFFWSIWSCIGLAYTIMILARVVIFVGGQLVAKLFSGSAKPIDLSPIIDAGATVYLNGFKDIHSAIFGTLEVTEKVTEPLSIRSFYEFVATLFLMYLIAAIVFPEIMLPNFTNWFDRSTISSEPQGLYRAGFWFLFAVIILVALLFIGFSFLRKVDSNKLVQSLVELNILTEPHLRHISNDLKISVPDLKEYLAKVEARRKSKDTDGVS